MIDPLWFLGFLLTLGIEVPIVAALAPRGHRGLTANIAVTAQMLTHPIAWLVVVQGYLGWWTVEARVVAVEAVICTIATGRPLRVFGVSLLANAASAYAGTILLP
jgi:hypothetical protein